MDDRDLEARLRAHFHTTLDHARPSVQLAERVTRGLAPRPAALGGLRMRARPSLGFGAVLATAAAIVIALAFGGVVHVPPFGAVPTPTTSTAPTGRDFIVLPPTSAVPGKPVSSDAYDVLAARLRALGFGTFSGSGGYGIAFELDEPGIASDDQVRAVLAAPGLVEFVPLPAADYSTIAPTVGKALPKDEPALFGSEGVSSVTVVTDAQGRPALDVHLTPAAAQAFGVYTARHVAEQVAIVIDGVVVSAPAIDAAITGGVVEISGDPSRTQSLFDPVTRAILIGGPLPEAWRGAPVPVVISGDDAKAVAFMEAGVRGEPKIQGLEARVVAGQWRAVWTVLVQGTFPDLHCTQTTGCPSPADAELVLIDAVNGGVIGYEAPSP
jgi:hypothetical protein